jgi:hypothetical protein
MGFVAKTKFSSDEEDGFAPLLSVEVVGVSSEYAGDSKE